MSGAAKAMSDFIPVNEPVIGEREKALVMECLNTGWISSEGPFISQFEEAFSRRVGRKHGVACANGTAALDLAVAALGLGPGDEVILPTFTIISCAAAIVRAGATPVVVDADPNTWNMVPEQVAAAISPRTAAIMVVHIYGLPVDMDPILELAARQGLAVIEDAAELIGGTYKDKPCGSFGTISTFSFYPNKHITTGEGGMIATNDASLSERCKSLRNLCFQPKQRFLHHELGWNYRMTNLQAALGLGQLERLDHTVMKKREIGLLYKHLFAANQHIHSQVDSTDFALNIYWVFGLLLKQENLFACDLIDELAKAGIGTRPFFYPLHLQPVFRAKKFFQSAHCPVAERLSRQGFYIPSGLALTADKQKIVAAKVASITQHFAESTT
ncbi:DegT/DnrJ/EryC1/StrS aminotransferase family protein [Cyanobium sp. CH-040]|uniref:DegT/DnrJ/EryC1/StrS family aminotransferase n=1 Tax=Cyanobium sp. CH-040 TaxID=2823708 RepID=UPI0020CE7828|nr:DegT/DnrJ/EryC1/StrS aminotransferase family protein [Cyanobium sp. CH-040]MCP9926735.1 DegT/DnrJ/EryC1/StrS aminotransferase family protein [Cyanobium sp. CH-040]